MTELEVRKVQQVGYSTLVVSLPREWVREVGLKQGDVVSLLREGDGTLRLVPGISKEGKEQLRAIIDADRCMEPGLLTRIITGIYIIGYDTIQIISRKGLSIEHLDEIRKTTQRLTGLSIVEQTLNYTIVQNFVDPTRFPVDGLLRRLYIITSSMQEAAFRALAERKGELALEVLNMENEVDKIYWLVVRQLLLATRDRSVGKKIGIESALHIVGNRTIAKFLEEIGDYSESIAKEVYRILESNFISDEEILEEMSELAWYVKHIYEKAIKAFFALDIKQANTVAGMVEEAEQRVDSLTEKIFKKLQAGDVGETNQLRVNSYLPVRSIISQLGQIAGACSTIAEITINRKLESESDYCKIEKV